MERWLTKRELAGHLQISVRTIERLRIPCTKVGGQNRYRLSEVLPFLRGGPQPEGNVVAFPSQRTRGAA